MSKILTGLCNNVCMPPQHSSSSFRQGHNYFKCQLTLHVTETGICTQLQSRRLEQMVRTQVSRGEKKKSDLRILGFTLRLSCSVGSKCGRKYLGTESAISTRDLRTESSFW